MNNIPISITGQRRQNLRRYLKKKIVEHELASSFPKFESPPHKTFFINRTTDESTLVYLIGTIKSTSTFTLDTESVGMTGEKNRPTLSQVEMVMMDRPSFIMLVEMYHLPSRTDRKFVLIEQLFSELFQPEKTILIWGQPDELNDFVIFRLFSTEQIRRANHIDAQTEFKQFWRSSFRHIEPNDERKCRCEGCLGIEETNRWSLQMAVHHCLAQWLDKRFTRSPFDIRLDPRLQHLNEKQREFRQKMVAYACNDCFAISRLLIHARLIERLGRSRHLCIAGFENDRYETTDDNNRREIINDEENRREPMNGDYDRRVTTNDEENRREPMNDDEYDRRDTMDNGDDRRDTINDDYDRRGRIADHRWNFANMERRDQIADRNEPVETRANSMQPRPNELTEEQRRRIHNRSCTLKQRKRYFRNTIIVNDVNKHLPIPRIKAMLRSANIQFHAVNTTSTGNRRTLFIGVKDGERLDEHRDRIRSMVERKRPVDRR